jgi:hypothetical protein
MNPEQLTGIISIFLLISSVALLWFSRRLSILPFIALIVYLAQVIFLNLEHTGMISVNAQTIYYVGLAHNLLDAPLMAFFLTYFAGSDLTRRFMIRVIAAFVVYEILILFIIGVNTRGLTYIIGPGLFIVNCFALHFFRKNLQHAMYQRIESGKAFITGGLVFTYLCFFFIFLLYYVFESPHVTDIYLIYHITYIALSLTLIFGIGAILKARMRPRPVKQTLQEDPNALQYL